MPFAYLHAVLPATFPAGYGLVHANLLTSVSGIAFNVIAAWLRFAAVATRSFDLALLSSVFLGFAAAVIICSYTRRTASSESRVKILAFAQADRVDHKTLSPSHPSPIFLACISCHPVCPRLI